MRSRAVPPLMIVLGESIAATSGAPAPVGAGRDPGTKTPPTSWTAGRSNAADSTVKLDRKVRGTPAALPGRQGGTGRMPQRCGSLRDGSRSPYGRRSRRNRRRRPSGSERSLRASPRARSPSCRPPAEEDPRTGREEMRPCRSSPPGPALPGKWTMRSCPGWGGTGVTGAPIGRHGARHRVLDGEVYPHVGQDTGKDPVPIVHPTGIQHLDQHFDVGRRRRTRSIPYPPSAGQRVPDLERQRASRSLRLGSARRDTGRYRSRRMSQPRLADAIRNTRYQRLGRGSPVDQLREALCHIRSHPLDRRR